MKSKNIKKLKAIQKELDLIKSDIRHKYGFSNPRSVFITMDLDKIKSKIQEIIESENQNP